MQFYTVSAVLALAATAFAQSNPTNGFTPVLTPLKDEVVAAGSTYTIKWQDTTGQPLTITLLGGKDPNTLVDLGVTIASDVDSKLTQYAWAVSSSLGKDATYGLKIALSSNPATFQYGFPFQIQGSSAGNSTSSASASASGYASATASASSSASASASGYPSTTMSRMTTTSAAPSVYSTMSASGNLSTTAVPTTRATTVVVLTSTGSSASATRSPTTVPTAAAGRVAAGSFALVGGIAAAFLAL